MVAAVDQVSLSIEKGAFFSATFTRTYTDAEGKFHDSDSFSGLDLLKIAQLVPKAYERIGKLRAAEKALAETDEQAAAA